MVDVIDYTIEGDDLQLVEIELDPGEEVRAEAGSMIYMSKEIDMDTKMEGGLFGGLKRAVSGESLLVAKFQNTGSQKGYVSFASPYPGKIIPIDLEDFGGTFLCQRDAYLCSAKGIDISVAFTKRLGAGFFGGEGFILQKLSAPSGKAFVHAGGTVVEKNLKEGEILKVDTGCIVGFDSRVDYSIETVGSIKNALFGGEGLFLATLRGPGKVFIQSLPLANLASTIASRIPHND